MRARMRASVRSSGSWRNARASVRNRSKNLSSSVIKVRQCLLQFPPRERQMRAYRTVGESSHLRDLRVLEFFDQMQARHDALHLRQLVQGGVDAPGDVVAHGRQLRVVAARG